MARPALARPALAGADWHFDFFLRRRRCTVTLHALRGTLHGWRGTVHGLCGTVRRRGRRGSSLGASGVTVLADHRQLGTDRDGFALRDQDLGDGPVDRGGHLGVDLVGRNLEQHLVLGDRVADLLVPLRDGALGDRFTELGHRDISQREDPFQPGRGWSRRKPPTAMGAAVRTGPRPLPWPPS